MMRCRGPPEDAGQQVLAELLVAPLRRAIQEAAAGTQLQRRQDPRLQGLPPAMIPNNPVGATSVCAMLASFTELGCTRAPPHGRQACLLLPVPTVTGFE